MRVSIEFESESGSLFLPIHYNHIVQGFIYDNISPELAKFLHEQGYTHIKRSFKLFTFSRLYGRFKIEGKYIVLNSPIKLQISSSNSHFLQEFAESLLRKGEVSFLNQPLRVNSIEVYPNPRFSRDVTIRTLSPVTVYSTLKTPDNRKKTYYYSPYEKEFSLLIERNLQKKFELIHHKAPDGYNLTIEPERRRLSEKVIKYKGTVVKGWMGRFRLEGSPELMLVAYDTGLGSKNSLGFGMFEVTKNA